ncbi:AAA family ATPase [Rhizobium leguminosarum]|uniref:AAA family ATPase n=1 Tax=Rhizobium leguminosarum TaxID=384 RepID=UPI001C980C13|nr:AAA family ATPase [Rhizobium leguminosarum]MBY5505319.1 AAA family ATPase [Rhizobium leguminosarum]
MTDKPQSQDRHFQRREKAAIAGLHLPTAEELLRGMAFFRKDLAEDIREYSGRLSGRVRKRQQAGLSLLVTSLDELAVEQSKDGVLAVETALDLIDDTQGLPVDECRLRCRFYRAFLGDGQATALIAGEIAHLASGDLLPWESRDLLLRSLSWAAHSRTLERRQRSGITFEASVRWFEHELGGYESHFRNAITSSTIDEPEPKDSSSAGLAVPTWGEEPSEYETRPTDGVVVINTIGNDTTADGKRVAKEFAKFKQRPLPLPGMPELTVVRGRLIAEFPYAAAVVDDVLEGLGCRLHVHLRPIILLGAPGSGKTRFARRLTEELGAPYELISCGGLSDSAIGGTARRWSSGEPSLAVMAVCRHECAGPVVILDEIEKIGTSRRNGNVHDVLIGLFEPETSRRWHDPYLQAHCDLSHVSWLMTANSLEPIPAPLRDRCRILRFPDPEADQLPLFATRILERLYIEAGHDPRWATPLEGFELDALASAWTGGSLRRLERLVEVLREARERARRLQ